MVRLLLEVYPTPLATRRGTVDADAAVDELEVVGSIVENLRADGFDQIKGNLFTKGVSNGQNVEVNLLAARRGSSTGIQTREVDGVGSVDTLPELAFVLAAGKIQVGITVELNDGNVISYQTVIPNLEAAVVLKAHSWKARSFDSDRDLQDINSLLEIRQAHPNTEWHLGTPALRGYRRDAARHLHDLAQILAKPRTTVKVPESLNRTRLRALISAHISQS